MDGPRNVTTKIPSRIGGKQSMPSIIRMITVSTPRPA